MKNKIFIYYPHSKNKGGHHNLFFNTIKGTLSKKYEIYSDQKIIIEGLGNIKESIELAKNYGCDSLFLPFLDAYVKDLWRNPISDLEGLKVISIWMNPLSYKLFQVSSYSFRMKEYLRRLLFKRNKFLYNSKMLTIDEYALPNMNSEGINTSFIPDPSPYKFKDKYINSETEFDILLYGAMTRRKGIHTLVKAINHLYTNEIKIKTKILGKINDNVLNTDEKIIFNNLVNEDIIVHIDRWVEDQEIIDSLIDSKIVVLPYENFYSSSGVLITATTFRKKVIASDNTGTLSSRIIDNNLGLLFKQCDYIDLAKKIIESLENKPLVESQELFSRKNTLKEFKKKLLNHTSEYLKI